jgi:hypothetical protein
MEAVAAGLDSHEREDGRVNSAHLHMGDVGSVMAVVAENARTEPREPRGWRRGVIDCVARQ